MNRIKSATKWMGGAAIAAAMFFGLSHKAEAQRVSFGVQIGGPVVVAQPAYPYAYAYNGGYYNGAYCDRDDWRRRQYWQHERWERERHYDRDYYRDYDHDRGRDLDRDHGYGYGYGYGRR
ncbi:hypothetical protein [Terriglobus albidus]|uniref:hypothetical protein n=1 Tax=Terriglobus albidus TaxID=1592106 RepID=UPI0021DFD07E|nr:hypothetical protein [Terriglobus albidus]